ARGYAELGELALEVRTLAAHHAQREIRSLERVPSQAERPLLTPALDPAAPQRDGQRERLLGPQERVLAWVVEPRPGPGEARARQVPAGIAARSLAARREQRAQDAVHVAGAPRAQPLARRADGLVHRRMVGHALEEQELRGADREQHRDLARG